MNRIELNLSRLPLPQKIETASQIVKAPTGNPDFHTSEAKSYGRSRTHRLRLNQLVCVIIALVILGAANVTPQTRRQRSNRIPRVQPPDPYPEFQALALLLGVKAEANIGAAITPQDRGLHTTISQPNLARFQLFRDTSNINNPINSVEMHKDGTIYVSYTPTLSPKWYDTIVAEDNHKNQTFDDLKKNNVDAGQWLPNPSAFPPGRGPAPRWIKLTIPGAPSSPMFQPDGWLNFLRSGSVQQINRLVPHATPMLPDSSKYCYGDTRDWTSVITRGDPPEWATVLPMRNGNDEFGQRTLFPGSPYNATTNPYVTWDKLMELMQSDPTTALDVLKWRGHPNTDDYNTDRVPWVSAATEGIVTNSFLSGGDYSGTHGDGPPAEYFLGSPRPGPSPRPSPYPFRLPSDCGGGPHDLNGSLCDDWIVYVKPDPEYRFLLARRMGQEIEQGNFDDEHQGDLENEIEQWLVPVGWRPEPGDRIHMTGRWAIDCGHNDWHGELHPFELSVSSHAEIGGRLAAINKTEAVSSVVITGAWQGGTLEFDVWPLARPEAGAILKWAGLTSIKTGLTVPCSLLGCEKAEPLDNPNHLHITVVSNAQTLSHGDVNDVYYNVARRLVAKYRLWWERPPENNVNRTN